MKPSSTNTMLWAILLILGILVGGVIWIRHDFGPNIAGAAVLGLALVLVFLLGQMVNIASARATLDGHARINAQEAVIEREREKTKRMELGYQHKFEGHVLRAAGVLSRLQFGYYKATDQAQQAAQVQAAPAAPDFWDMAHEPAEEFGEEIQGLF